MFIKNGIEFETDSGTKYIYCSDTCMVFEKSEIDDNKISKERKENWENIYKEFHNMDKNKPNIENVENLKRYLYRNGFNELILEVTTSCNLRCKYCVFSGNYDGQRNHGSEKMELETAIKAIKMYYNYYLEVKQYNPNTRPVIAFFGGEPLLNIDLIKKCLEYINSIFEKEDNIYLTITTNGTLLSDDIIKFLKNENVDIILSLDGPKEINDKNRVFQNGEGTFEVVMEKIKSMKSITKRPVFINSVYDLNTNLEDIFDFFDSNPQLMNLGISPVSNVNTNYYEKFSQKTIDDFYKKKNDLEKIFKQKTEEYNKNNKNNKNPFIGQFFGRQCNPMLMKQILSNRNSPINYTGACTPGQKIFVDTQGILYACEKVERDFIIGEVDNGLNFEQILKIINDFNKCCDGCEKCPIHNQCSLCYCYMMKNGKFEKNINVCNRLIKNFKERLTLTYSVLEKNPEWFSFFVDKYYGEFKKWEVCKRC